MNQHLFTDLVESDQEAISGGARPPIGAGLILGVFASVVLPVVLSYSDQIKTKIWALKSNTPV